MPIGIALQLYTIREETAQDFLGACASVKAFGCDKVELAGFGGMNAEDLRQKLDDIGLQVIGSHIGLESAIDSADTIRDHLALGCKFVTVPWLADEHRSSVEAWRATARVLDDAAKRFQDAGLRLGYHNHAIEFAATDGNACGWEILFEEAQNLDAQVDVFWVAKAGHDPGAVIEALAGRVPTIHAKDLAEDGEDVEIGRGVLDWSAIRAAAERSGVQIAIAEMDNPRLEPLKSAEECVAGLRAVLHRR